MTRFRAQPPRSGAENQTGEAGRLLDQMPRAIDTLDSYWVVPDKLLAGEYPGTAWFERAEEKLHSLLDAGVTYFIDLTTSDDPLERYEEQLEKIAAEKGIDVTYVNHPIADRGCPSERDMKTILDEIDSAIAAGHTVYVHCWGGVGRTGTVVGCHLVRCGMTGGDALARVLELFEDGSPRKAGRISSPEMPQQREFVTRWTEPAIAPSQGTQKKGKN